jgi:hypothetical protein
VTGRFTAAVVISATLIVPAAASGATGSIFSMTAARGFERVTFTGDSAASCEQFGVCGYTGKVEYSIGGTPHGTIVLARSRGGKISGGATYRTEGSTSATVTPPGGAPACSDTITHSTDLFSAASQPHSVKTLLLSYDTAGDDFLATTCPGPTKRDAALAGALPKATFSASGFHGKKLRFGFGGSVPFKGHGFTATSEWRLSFRAAGRSCNPRCAIPAHQPR